MLKFKKFFHGLTPAKCFYFWFIIFVMLLGILAMLSIPVMVIASKLFLSCLSFLCQFKIILLCFSVISLVEGLSSVLFWEIFKFPQD
jgi:hypothetical protein